MSDINKEIKNVEYFRKKLNSFLDTYNNENIITLRDKETRDNVKSLIKEIDEYIFDIKNDKLYELKSQFLNIINDLKDELSFNKTLVKPIKININSYNEKAYSKLNYIFRKNKLLSDEEARNVYDNNYDTLYEKYVMFLDLINWLNDNGLSIIPEKTLFSAYLGISVDTYNFLLKNASDSRVRNLFLNIDEYFTTTQFGALISDDRKSLERIQKTEIYGQEMRQTQPDTLIQNNTANLSYSELMLLISKKKQNLIEQ